VRSPAASAATVSLKSPRRGGESSSFSVQEVDARTNSTFDAVYRVQTQGRLPSGFSAVISKSFRYTFEQAAETEEVGHIKPVPIVHAGETEVGVASASNVAGLVRSVERYVMEAHAADNRPIAQRSYVSVMSWNELSLSGVAPSAACAPAGAASLLETRSEMAPLQPELDESLIHEFDRLQENEDAMMAAADVSGRSLVSTSANQSMAGFIGALGSVGYNLKVIAGLRSQLTAAKDAAESAAALAVDLDASLDVLAKGPADQHDVHRMTCTNHYTKLQGIIRLSEGEGLLSMFSFKAAEKPAADSKVRGMSVEAEEVSERVRERWMERG
jgi:hypothetical protein